MVENNRRETALKPLNTLKKNSTYLDRERHALRALIDQLCDQPQTDNDNGFYRKVGVYIARPMMKPRWPGDTGY